MISCYFCYFFSKTFLSFFSKETGKALSDVVVVREDLKFLRIWFEGKFAFHFFQDLKYESKTL